MVVDTGAITTVVSDEIASQAGLANELFGGPVTLSTAAGRVPAYQTTVKQFTLGNAAATDMQIVALSKPTSPLVFGTRTSVDGTLGNDVWPNYDLDLDFPKQTMTLYDKTSCATLPLSWTGHVSAVPVTIDDYGYILVPVSVDGHAFTAMLDTGTSVSIIPPSLIAQAGLSDASSTVRPFRLAAPGGVVRTQLRRFHEMIIGGEKTENPIFAVPVTDPVAEKIQELLEKMPHASDPFFLYKSDQDMILGEDFIRTHRLFISYATHTLYIQN